MAKPPRSPILGYNHNVKYGGHVFHVQTEDSGPGNPHLFTHLFFEGSILASKRSQYEPTLSEDEVRALMQTQHKSILKELKQAAYDEGICSFFSRRGESFPAEDVLDDTGSAACLNELADPAAVIEEAIPETSADILDLDAVDKDPIDRTSTPEPLPIHVTNPAMPPSPGAYTFRRPTRERFSPVVEEPSPHPVSSRPATSRPIPVRPNTPVIVQRQIVVGTGTAPSAPSAPPTPVRRRPGQGVPYVVKEGSHVRSSLSAAAASGRSAAPPPRPIAPTPEPPRTAAPKPTLQQGSPTPSTPDQSLDDVILAYLSQGEEKR